MRQVAMLFVGLLILAGVAVASGATQARWLVRNLGSGSAIAVNDRGQVVGYRSTGKMNQLGAVLHAFIWTNGKTTDLGTLGRGSSVAVALNERGQAAGDRRFSAKDKYGTEILHAFLWENGTMRDLGTLGRGWSRAVAINDVGLVIGITSKVYGEQDRAFLWANGKMHDLGTLGGPESFPTAINAGGQIVGYADTKAKGADGGPIFHGVLWAKSKIRDLGTLGGPRSMAVAINARGQIVGWSDTTVRDGSGFIEHAFLWENGQMRDLGVEGQAVAINERGQILVCGDDENLLWQNGTVRTVRSQERFTEALALSERGLVVGYGWSKDQGDTPGAAGEPIPHAFVWADGKTTALPTLPGGSESSFSVSSWSLGVSPFPPAVINGRGQIVGWSSTKTSGRHAVLWTLKR